MPLPDGLAWRDLDATLIEEFLRVYRAAFADLPGVYFADEAEQRRVLAVGRGAVRVLCDGGRILAALRYAPDEAFLHSIVRDPEAKGRGLGRLVLDEARRCLPGRALTLNVVSSNRVALELYTRHGFAITADRDVLTKSTPSSRH
jgi:GNAT superfamily N-acetyltransferase